MNRFFLTLLLLLILVPGIRSHAQLLPSRSCVMLNDGPIEQARTSEFAFPQNFLDGLVANAFDTTLGSRIQSAMEATLARTSPWGKHGIGASVIVPRLAQWTGAVGMSDETTPIDPAMLFEIGSTSKTFITALILKLEEEGVLSIKDSVSKWLSPIENVNPNITLQQLLAHSSGVFDYVNGSTDLIYDAYDYHPSRHWTPEELLTYVGPPNFDPGKSYAYSNTGFLLLGMIAEKATGHSLSSEFHTRFFAPLGLTHTFCGWSDTIVGEFAHNWTTSDSVNPSNDLYAIDKTAQLSQAYSAGGIVSTPEDLTKWADALYNGRLLSKASMTKMFAMHTWPNGSVYGLGVSRIPYYSKSLYGHGGRLIGFNTMMYTCPKDTTTFVLYMNSDAPANDVTLNDYALAILGEMYSAPKSVAVSAPRQISVATYPNPFTDRATIAFSLPAREHVRIALYDEMGREVRLVANETTTGGVHSWSIDGRTLTPGRYFYMVRTNSGSTTGKIELTR